MKKKTIDVQLTPNFTLSEFCITSKNFDVFKIPYDYFINIERLAALLQNLRDYMKKPVRISSGFRPKRLNSLVHGAKNSYHLVGAAVDIYFKNNKDFEKAWDFLETIYYEDKSEHFIQELLGCPTNNWLHISIWCPQREFIEHDIKYIKKDFYKH